MSSKQRSIFFLNSTDVKQIVELTAAALKEKNTFSLDVGKKLFNINPII